MDKQLICGMHPVLEALETGVALDKVLLKKGGVGQARTQIIDLCTAANIPWQEVPVEKLNRTVNARHQGVVAWKSIIQYQDPLELVTQAFERGEQPLLVALDRVTDVRNLGALSRSALCFGAHGLLVPSRGTAPIQEGAIKSSAGALLHLPVCRAWNLKDSLLELKNSGLQLVALTEKANTQIQHCPLTGPLLLLMGSEEDGISPAYLELCDHKAAIPQVQGPVGSLNVSVATGIALYECARQRHEQQL